VSDFDARQIVVAHEKLWEDLETWGNARGLMLVRIPAGIDENGALTMDPGDDLPPYAFMPKEM
jgi:hypothetical protein